MSDIIPTIHGTPVNACEERGSALIMGQDRNWYFVVASKNFLININLNTKETTQINMPAGHNATFAARGSLDGFFYTCNGQAFLQFNPAENRITDFIYDKSFSDIVAMRLSPTQSDYVYMIGYPDCMLRRYDTLRKRIEPLVQLDDREKYGTALIVGHDGYLYAGIGYERMNLVAYHIETGKTTSLFDESMRRKGGVFLYRGIDKKIYFRPTDEEKWGQVHKGAISAHDVEFPGTLTVAKPGNSFHEIHTPTGQKDLIESYSVDRCFVKYTHPQTNEHVHLRFEYTSEGAELSPLTDDGHGLIYGTSNHPLHFYSYEPKTDVFIDYEDQPLRASFPNETTNIKPKDRISGNICTYARHESLIGGAAYAGGYVFLFDSKKPVQSMKNPKNVATYEQMHRPRGAAFSKDGRLFASGGFGGYGAVGGAFCLYDVIDQTSKIITHDQFAPYESPVAMDFDNRNQLIIGTSTETPGGGRQKAKCASIVVWDPQNNSCSMREHPNRDIQTIHLLHCDTQGRVHAFAEKNIYFVYDIAKKKTIHKTKIRNAGSIVQNGCIVKEDQCILLMQKAFFSINLNDFSVKKIASIGMDCTMGGAAIANRIYFASKQKLCSIEYDMEDLTCAT